MSSSFQSYQLFEKLQVSKIAHFEVKIIKIANSSDFYKVSNFPLIVGICDIFILRPENEQKIGNTAKLQLLDPVSSLETLKYCSLHAWNTGTK